MSQAKEPFSRLKRLPHTQFRRRKSHGSLNGTFGASRESSGSKLILILYQSRHKVVNVGTLEDHSKHRMKFRVVELILMRLRPTLLKQAGRFV